MKEETKSRLRARLAEVVDSLTDRPKTIDEWESLVLDLRERCAQAAFEEIREELSETAQIDGASDVPPLAENASPSSESEAEVETGDSPAACSCKLPCPRCGKNAWFKGTRSRKIVTLAGSLVFLRRYYSCRNCQHGFCPLDAALGLAAGSSMTLRLQEELAYLCACLPYRQSIATLHRLTGMVISARTAQRLCVGPAGTAAQAYTQSQEGEMLPLAYEQPARLPEVAPDLPQPAVLYTAADGIQTPMRDGGWREMKIGVVQSRHRDGRIDQPSRYIGHLGDSDRFGRLWEALGISRGSLGAQQVVVLGDGAPWLWRKAEEHFPVATHILDFFHAMEYVGSVARAAFSAGETTTQAHAKSTKSTTGGATRKWLSERASEMKRSQWDKVTNALKAVRSMTGAAEEAVDTALRYFRNNVDRMDYAHYLRQGLSIGSGLVEASCKRLVTQRLKGSGMRWSEKGAQAVCTLRCLLLGEEGRQWSEFGNFWKNYQTNCQTNNRATAT